MNIRSNEQLIDYVNYGNNVKYVFFWGHQKSNKGLSKTCFSQWYESSFELDGVIYQTAEHYMMSEKAKLFGDAEIALKIIAANNPGEAKKLGRLVKNYNEEIWLQHRFDIVVKANTLKFSQNDELKEFLLNTGSKILVEASPVDNIWGIGLASDNPSIENPNLWKGLNLLGYALMEVRERLVD